MKVRWDTDILNSYINTINSEKQNLQSQKNEMTRQLTSVNISWKSPAGQDYQNRLKGDIDVLDNTIKQVTRQVSALQKVLGRYKNCEEAVAKSLRRLP